MTKNPWILLILMVFAVAILVFILIQQLEKTKKQQQQKQLPFPRTSKSSQPSRKIGTVPNHLKKKLLRMVGGNQETAERLVENIRLRNPGQKEIWYWEKVIFDLERDRH